MTKFPNFSKLTKFFQKVAAARRAAVPFSGGPDNSLSGRARDSSHARRKLLPSLVPKLYLGTQLSAQFHCSVGSCRTPCDGASLPFRDPELTAVRNTEGPVPSVAAVYDRRVAVDLRATVPFSLVPRLCLGTHLSPQLRCMPFIQPQRGWNPLAQRWHEAPTLGRPQTQPTLEGSLVPRLCLGTHLSAQLRCMPFPQPQRGWNQIYRMLSFPLVPHLLLKMRIAKMNQSTPHQNFVNLVKFGNLVILP
jgi:hypothetical protein